MNTAYASFGKRLVAVIIDAIVIGIAQSFVIVPILGLIGLKFIDESAGMDMEDPENVKALVGSFMAAAAGIWLVSLAIQVVYYSLMESSKFQATLGKLALGIKVTDMNGNKLDYSKALVRALSRILSGFIMLIGYIIAAFTEKKQALHDLIAGTSVLEK